MFDSIENPPAWAYTWCYVFFIGAVLAFLGTLAVIYTTGSKLGTAGTVTLLVTAFAQVATGMTYFWMCRSSLKQYA